MTAKEKFFEYVTNNQFEQLSCDKDPITLYQKITEDNTYLAIMEVIEYGNGKTEEIYKVVDFGKPSDIFQNDDILLTMLQSQQFKGCEEIILNWLRSGGSTSSLPFALSELYFNDIHFKSVFLKFENDKLVGYKWFATSNDGAYEAQSGVYKTKELCYENMRNAVLEKMKWNTNYHEDFERENGMPIEDEENCIGYDVKFYPHKITHESFSGLYTYIMTEVYE